MKLMHPQRKGFRQYSNACFGNEPIFFLFWSFSIPQNHHLPFNLKRCRLISGVLFHFSHKYAIIYLPQLSLEISWKFWEVLVVNISAQELCLQFIFSLLSVINKRKTEMVVICRYTHDKYSSISNFHFL